MNFKIVFDKDTETYTVEADGEPIMECLGQEELAQISLIDVIDAWVSM